MLVVRKMGRLVAAALVAALLLVTYSPASEWAHVAAHAAESDHDHEHDLPGDPREETSEVAHRHALPPQTAGAFVVSSLFVAPLVALPVLSVPEVERVSGTSPPLRLSAAAGRPSRARAPPHCA